MTSYLGAAKREPCRPPSYREDARPFLHGLYGLLERDAEIQTVSFGECLGGNPAWGIVPHPLETQIKVYDLFTDSWIDESASAPGVDLGTWIGEDEENRGWELLGQAWSEIYAKPSSKLQAPVMMVWYTLKRNELAHNH